MIGLLRLDWLWRLLEQGRAPEPPIRVAPLALVVDETGWLQGPQVVRIPSQRDWYYRRLRTADGLPDGVTWHYTATDYGTAIPMAERRRDRPRKSWPKGRRPGSWHVTVCENGGLVQQVSFLCGAFHAGSATARRLPIGWANRVTVGIELEGYGDEFSPAQVEGAFRLLHALAAAYAIEREHAMYYHSWIDPTRRSDPGQVWDREHAQAVLDAVYR